ncbi:MAG: hypothetical protein KAI47_07370 [Deltaproteobacteria bacterium]|nr:hypothetical protein [Deltaproteobacteria bacterium]
MGQRSQKEYNARQAKRETKEAIRRYLKTMLGNSTIRFSHKTGSPSSESVLRRVEFERWRLILFDALLNNMGTLQTMAPKEAIKTISRHVGVAYLRDNLRLQQIKNGALLISQGDVKGVRNIVYRGHDYTMDPEHTSICLLKAFQPVFGEDGLLDKTLDIDGPEVSGPMPSVRGGTAQLSLDRNKRDNSPTPADWKKLGIKWNDRKVPGLSDLIKACVTRAATPAPDSADELTTRLRRQVRGHILVLRDYCDELRWSRMQQSFPTALQVARTIRRGNLGGKSLIQKEMSRWEQEFALLLKLERELSSLKILNQMVEVTSGPAQVAWAEWLERLAVMEQQRDLLIKLANPNEGFAEDARPYVLRAMEGVNFQGERYVEALAEVPILPSKTGFDVRHWRRFRRLRDRAIAHLQKTLLELTMVMALGKEKLAEIDKVLPDLQRVAKEAEDVVRTLNGLRIYLKNIKSSWMRPTLRAVIAAIFSKYDPEQLLVASIAVSISVGVAFDLIDAKYAKLGAHATITFQGVITQEDDRRLRFKGSVTLSAGAESSVDVGASVVDGAIAGANAVGELYNGITDALEDLPGLGKTPKIPSIPEEITLDKESRTTLSTHLSSLSTKSGNDEDTSIQTDVLSLKAKAAIESDLLSGGFVKVYSDLEHMATNWAERVVRIKNFFKYPFHNFPGFQGVTDSKVRMHLRDLNTKESQLLDILTGQVRDEESQPEITLEQKDLQLIRKTLEAYVTNAWHGKILGGTQVTGDFKANLPGYGYARHGENLVADHRSFYFKRRRSLSYTDDVVVRDEGGQRKPMKQTYYVTAGNKGTQQITVKTWSDNKPIRKTMEGSVSWTKSTSDRSTVYDPWDRKEYTETVGSLGLGFSGGTAITWTHIPQHPNWDNEGHYLNLKVDRAFGGGGTPVYLDLSFSVTAGKSPDYRDLIRILRFFELSSYQDKGRLGDYLAGNVIPEETITAVTKTWHPRLCDALKETAIKGPLSQLGKYGSVELNYVLSERKGEGQQKIPEFVLQYGRVWRNREISVGGKIPVVAVPGLSVTLGGNFSLSFGMMEILGANTVTYWKTVYDGFRNRADWETSDKWRLYKEIHALELSDLCSAVADDNSVAHCEVVGDELDEGRAFIRECRRRVGRRETEGFSEAIAARYKDIAALKRKVKPIPSETVSATEFQTGRDILAVFDTYLEAVRQTAMNDKAPHWMVE